MIDAGVDNAPAMISGRVQRWTRGMGRVVAPLLRRVRNIAAEIADGEDALIVIKVAIAIVMLGGAIILASALIATAVLVFTSIVGG